ncbi:tetratricopeptide repeat protein [Poriferisphaera corsica]|uniref:Tetratricopeptide repeat protein n=1 Tax=Poriferisphaera corsica TaxID=2528020 RepID=A0A517YXK9_9BACT|nr:tetratricopeptide repeat protein [Poriferisphaera corsica]QDU34953.1 tetratricopeptide repeat protein [Poriferisphaera corsica]
MAGRVNTKFVFMLSAIIIFLVVGLAGVYMVFMRNNPQELMRNGDKFVSEKEYFLAIESYAKAVAKDPTNTDYLEKYITLFPELKIEGIVDARRYLGQKRTAYKMLSELATDDLAKQSAYYELILDSTKRLSRTYADSLYNEADEWLSNYPDNVIARKYRGIARVITIHGNMTDADREQAFNDLETAGKTLENDPDIPYYIAQYLLFEGSRLDTEQGDRQLAAELRDAAAQYAEQYATRLNNEPEHLINYARLMISPQLSPRIPIGASEEYKQQVLNNANARVASMKPIIDQLEQITLTDQSLDPYYCAQIADLLLRTDTRIIKRENRNPTTSGVQRAIAILDSSFQSKTNSVFLMRELGKYYRLQGDVELALPFYQKAMNTPNITNAAEFLINRMIQFDAAKSCGEIMIVQAAREKDVDKKAKLLAGVDKTIDYITKRDDAPIIAETLRAKKLVAEEKLNEAMPLLEKCLKQLGNSDPQLMQLAAEARLKQGNWGSAISLFEEYLQVRPTDTRTMRRIAALYIQHKQHAKARPIINKLLAIDDTDKSVLALHAVILAYESNIDEAINVYLGLNPDENPSYYQMLTQLYLAKKDVDSARESALKYFEADPSNIQALQSALNLIEAPEQRQQLMQIASDAGADARTIRLMSEKQAGNLEDLAPEELANLINEGVDDPFQKLLNEITVYARSKQKEALKTAIDKASEMKPNDPRVLELQYNYAVSEKQFEEAEKLLPKISELDIDKAQGNIFRGKLYAVQGQYDLAEASYSRALALTDVNSSLWTQYAQVLLINKKLPEAEDAYKKSIQQKPDNVSAHRGLAQLFHQTGRGIDALNQIKLARKFEPRNAEILNIYLQLEQQYGNKEAVKSIREQIATAMPQDFNNRRILAGLYADLEDFDKAITTMQAIVKEEGENSFNILALANIFAVSGKANDGETVIRQYIAGRIDEVTVQDHLILARYLAQYSRDRDSILKAFQVAMDAEDPKARLASREFADLLFNRKLLAEASEVYKSILESDPADVRVVLRLAETYIKNDQFDDAAKLLEGFDTEAAEFGTSESLVLRALIAMNQKDYDEAIKLTNQAIRNDRENGRLYYQRARMLSMQPDRLEDALKDYNRTLELEPSMITPRRELAQIHVRRGYIDDAIRELENLLSINDRDLIGRLQLIQVLQTNNMILDAKARIQEGADIFPDDPRWPLMLGDLELKQGNFKEAVNAKIAAMNIAPNDNTLTQIGNLVIQANRPDKLIEIYDMYPTNANNGYARAQRGRALIMLGQQDAGEDMLKKAFDDTNNYSQFTTVAQQVKLALDEDYLRTLMSSQTIAERQLWSELLTAELALSNNDHAAVAEIVKKALPLLQGDLKTRALRLLASSSYVIDDITAAKDAYETILTINPKDIGTLNNLAYLLSEDLKSPQQAVALAEDAYTAAPNNPQILDTYGWILYRLEDYSKARTILEQSVQIKPLPTTLIHLGTVYQELNMLSQAISALEEGLKLAQNSNDEENILQAQNLLKELGQ